MFSFDPHPTCGDAEPLSIRGIWNEVLQVLRPHARCASATYGPGPSHQQGGSGRDSTRCSRHSGLHGAVQATQQAWASNALATKSWRTDVCTGHRCGVFGGWKKRQKSTSNRVMGGALFRVGMWHLNIIPHEPVSSPHAARWTPSRHLACPLLGREVRPPGLVEPEEPSARLWAAHSPAVCADGWGSVVLREKLEIGVLKERIVEYVNQPANSQQFLLCHLCRDLFCWRCFVDVCLKQDGTGRTL